MRTCDAASAAARAARRRRSRWSSTGAVATGGRAFPPRPELLEQTEAVSELGFVLASRDWENREDAVEASVEALEGCQYRVGSLFGLSPLDLKCAAPAAL